MKPEHREWMPEIVSRLAEGPDLLRLLS